ncbi:MAG: hypothetical protein HOP28_01390 [Gemmatimonadales bacterium]|nr:hypothetical protein [Gemmatimonadales bacterium]
MILPPQHVRTGYDFFKMHNQGPHEVYRALLLGGLPLIALAYADVIRDALVRRYGRPARSFGVCIS